MTAETDLLPCPWCGEKLASVSVSEGSTFRWRKVDGCCADGPEVRHDTMADDQVAAEVESRAAAIAAWNRRANVAHAVAPLQAEVEALLRQALEALESADWYIGQLEWLVYSPDDTETHEERAKVQSAIADLRERLGEGGRDDLRQGDQQ